MAFAQAVQNGSWHDQTTWNPPMVPQPTDFVEIPSGITVTISGPASDAIGRVQIYSPGSLVISGTLDLTLAPSPGQFPKIGIFLNDYPDNPGTSLTVNAGGTITMDLTGVPDANAHGIDANGQCTVTNAGTINLKCHKTVGPGQYAGLSYGLVVTDPRSSMVNTGTINILKSDAASDGNGACFGVYVRGGNFVNHATGTITSTADAIGIVSVTGGNFVNNGVFVNSGLILNTGGTVSNTGTLVNVFPNADYQGIGGVTGTGTIGLAGSPGGTFGLDEVAEIYQTSTRTFSLASGTSLTLQATFKIPAGYTLTCAGAVQNAGFLENNGLLRYVLPTAAAPNATIPGTGMFAITGGVGVGTTLDLSKFGGTSYHVQLHDTFTVPSTGTLSVPAGVTLTLDNWATLAVASNGTVTVGGTIRNDHAIANAGTMRYVFPGAVYDPGTGAGAGTITGTGNTTLSGTVSSAVSLASYGVTAYQVAATDTLTVDAALTVPSGCTLTILGTLNLGNTLSNNGTVTNSGTLAYSFPGAALAGTIGGSGVFAVQGTVSGETSLGDYGNLSYKVTAQSLLTVSGASARLTIPSGTALDIAGELNFRDHGVLSSAGAITNSGRITCLDGTLTHIFPTASYTRIDSGTIASALTVALQGEVTTATNLGTLGYGCSVYAVLATRTLSLAAQFTIPQGVTLSNAGTISGTGSISLTGTLKHAFPTALCSASVTGTGGVALLGSIQSAMNLGAIGYGNRIFSVQANDTLSIVGSGSLVVPSQCAIGNAGSIAVDVHGTLALNDHPGTTNSVLGNTGSFFNSGTVTIANTVAQSCGILSSGTAAEFRNSGSIALNNTNGVGLRLLMMTNSATNEGTITVSAAYAAAACNREAAAISNDSKLNNTDGTIAASTTVDSVWNTGTICGGTYTGRSATTVSQTASC